MIWSKAKVHPLVILAYVIIIGTIIGRFGYPNVPILFWIVHALVGGILLVLKNLYINNKKYVMTVTLSDITAVLLLFLLAYILPAYMGLIKQLLIAVIGALYVQVICKRYFLVTEE